MLTATCSSPATLPHYQIGLIRWPRACLVGNIPALNTVWRVDTLSGSPQSQRNKVSCSRLRAACPQVSHVGQIFRSCRARFAASELPGPRRNLEIGSEELARASRHVVHGPSALQVHLSLCASTLATLHTGPSHRPKSLPGHFKMRWNQPVRSQIRPTV